MKDGWSFPLYSIFHDTGAFGRGAPEIKQEVLIMEKEQEMIRLFKKLNAKQKDGIIRLTEMIKTKRNTGVKDIENDPEILKEMELLKSL